MNNNSPNNTPHKKSILNFNAYEWSVDMPVQKPKKVVPPSPSVNNKTIGVDTSTSHVNTNSISSVTSINGKKSKKKKGRGKIAAVVIVLILVVSVAGGILSSLNKCQKCGTFFSGTSYSYQDADGITYYNCCYDCYEHTCEDCEAIYMGDIYSYKDADGIMHNNCCYDCYEHTCEDCGEIYTGDIYTYYSYDEPWYVCEDCYDWYYYSY